MKEKFTIESFRTAKQTGEKITMLTAYDYSTARCFDDAGVDVLLIGDSLGMVMLGYENTLQVTVEDIIHHSKAVVRGTNRAWTVADLPFLSYHISDEDSIRNAGRIIKETNVHSVKLEGGIDMASRITALVKAQIPVMGHIGLTPQSVNLFGGFKAQGKSLTAAKKVIDDALAVEAAGAYAIVLECIPAPLAAIISKKLTIPTIGIGAGNECDGQVLVMQDFLGLFDGHRPKFIKAYADMKNIIREAVNTFAIQINNGTFPGQEHIYNMDEDILKKLSADN